MPGKKDQYFVLAMGIRLPASEATLNRLARCFLVEEESHGKAKVILQPAGHDLSVVDGISQGAMTSPIVVYADYEGIFVARSFGRCGLDFCAPPSVTHSQVVSHT